MLIWEEGHIAIPQARRRCHATACNSESSACVEGMDLTCIMSSENSPLSPILEIRKPCEITWP